jgi:hypothetical protein
MSVARGYLGSYPTNLPKLCYGVVSKKSSDSASGLETITYRFIRLFDSASGADSVFNRSIVLVDSASSIDIYTSIRKVQLDSAFGSDWISVITRITVGVPPLLFGSLETSAFPTASILLHTPITKKVSSDSASCADNILSRSFTELDSAYTVDIVIKRNFVELDSASALDISRYIRLPVSDSSSGLDLLLCLSFLSIDSASALDAIPRRSFTELDLASAVDILAPTRRFTEPDFAEAYDISKYIRIRTLDSILALDVVSERLFTEVEVASSAELARWMFILKDLLYLTETSAIYLSSADKMRTWDTRELLRYKIDTIWLSDIGRRAIIKAEHHDLRVDALLFICELARKKLES